MKLNHLNMIDFLHKPRMETAITLHKLYDSSDVGIPSVEQIIMNHIITIKKVDEELKELYDDDYEDTGLIELCGLIDVDIEDINPISFDGGAFNG